MALIQCPECGKTFSNTVKKCPNCGYKIRKEKKKIEKGTKIKICSVLIAGILLIAIAITSFLVLTSPVRKIENLLKQGSVTQAQTIFDEKIKNNQKEKDKLKEQLSSLYKKSIQIYAEDTDKYTVYKNINVFVEKNYTDFDSSSYKKEMDKMRNSKAHYQEAKKLQQEEKYLKAVDSYEAVLKEDPLYKNAQQESEKCKQKHKEKIIEEIDAQIAQDVPEYSELEIEITTTKYLKEDKQVNEKLSQLKKAVCDCQINRAHKYVESKKYLDALKALEEISLDYANDENVTQVKSTITDEAINFALKDAATLGKKKKYSEAIKLLKEYEKYDQKNIIAEKISFYEKKVEKAIIAEFKTLKKRLTLKYDSVDQQYDVVYKGYSPNSVNVSRTINIEARAIVDKKEKDVDFDLLVGFQQDDWIFTEFVKFASGNYRSTYLIEYADRYTQVLNGDIAEWMYLDHLQNAEVFDGMKKLISHITTSKKASIRFSAPGNGSRNHVITNTEKRNVKTVYKFCELLKKYDFLYKYI